jgi:hypothetical protein
LFFIPKSSSGISDGKEKKAVKVAIVDERLPKNMEEELSARGFEIIRLPPAKKLSAPVASHTDMLLFHGNKALIGSEEYFRENEGLEAKLKSALPDYRIIKTDDVFSAEYPYDTVFNARKMGKFIIAREKSISNGIKTYAKNEGLEIISVNQGYSACLTLPIGDKLVYTSDKGIAGKVENFGIKAKIIPEYACISLPPYKNGFIGGCCGVYGNDIYFIGNAEALPCYGELKSDADALGYNIISLEPSGDLLLDLGGIIFAE